jgi:NADH dehydrogenase (ubiquinone) 1 beta subcomplex subunit 9
MPGGTLFMRNPPPPLEVCFPDGIYPADAPKVRLNPDMTVSKPETGKSAVFSVLVDFTKKQME